MKKARELNLYLKSTLINASCLYDGVKGFFFSAFFKQRKLTSALLYNKTA